MIVIALFHEEADPSGSRPFSLKFESGCLALMNLHHLHAHGKIIAAIATKSLQVCPYAGAPSSRKSFQSQDHRFMAQFVQWPHECGVDEGAIILF